MTTEPQGFASVSLPLGLADDGRDDFTVVVSRVPATVAAVYTRSRFAGPSVHLSRAASEAGAGRGFLVLARNANVATGREGLENATTVRLRVAEAVGVAAEEMLIASTGVIARQYPMDRILPGLDRIPAGLPDLDADAVAAAIMTTDTRPKVRRARAGNATIVGVAKGVGMLEPNMATMLSFVMTDARVPVPELDAAFRRAVAVSFNAVSIDTDTSTSDTAAVFANGLAGEVDAAGFESALTEVLVGLAKDIARDGEGAGKLIQVTVRGARDGDQAKRVAKAVVNSPLVKTMVNGADPNWGRIAMAVGKCEDDEDIVPENVTITAGSWTVLDRGDPTDQLYDAVAALSGETVELGVDLGIADGAFVAYGCDLTAGYVEINGAYAS